MTRTKAQQQPTVPAITVQIEIPCDRIANLMCSAVESGDPVTRGWCGGIYYKAKGHKLPKGWKGTCWYYDHPELYAADDLQLEIVEIDEDADKPTKHAVNRERLLRGIATMATKFPDEFAQIMHDDTDASTADVFLQCVLFGEEKYA